MLRDSIVLAVLVASLVTASAAIDAEEKKMEAKAPTAAIVTLEKGGQLSIEFFPKDAPKTVDNFATLARQGFYAGQRFHRVENWVVQVGDPLSKTASMDDPRMGQGGPGYTIKAEFNKRRHDRGVVGMARGQDPDSAGSQFYILLKPAYHLDGQYTVFGRVVKGMEIVDALQVGDRITSVTID